MHRALFDRAAAAFGERPALQAASFVPDSTVADRLRARVMSYDLIFWKGRVPGDPKETWEALHAGTELEGLEPLSTTQIEHALLAEFGSSVRIDGSVVRGAGFELDASDGARHLHVVCTWELLKSLEGRTTLAGIRAALVDGLGCHCYNPQIDQFRPAPTTEATTRERPSVEATSPGKMPRVELEDALRTEFERRLWRAYGDVLTSEGDERGELIRIEYPTDEVSRVSDEAHKRAADLEKAHRGKWMGPVLEDAVDRKVVELSWRSGFIEGATFRLKSVAPNRCLSIVQHVLRHSSSRFVRSLRIELLLESSNETGEAIVQAIAEAPQVAGLKTLAINAFDADEASCLALGDLTRLIHRASGLRSLDVSGETLRLAPVVHGRLETLEVRSPVLGASLPALAQSRFERLRRLLLWCGTAKHPASIDPAQLALIVERTAPALEVLQLARIADFPRVVEALGRRGLPTTLTRIVVDAMDEPIARQLLDLRRQGVTLPQLRFSTCPISDALALELGASFGNSLDIAHPALRSARKAAVRSESAQPSEKKGFTIAVGARVRHAKFGDGVIVSVEGPAKIGVRFDDGAERKLNPQFVTETTETG